ncbi:hypothetical protein E4T56_gene10757 [Termitomyces sp. T112]|nr:hypothetical protein E4T56_gene10757 [Termitomyces sp. T112]
MKSFPPPCLTNNALRHMAGALKTTPIKVLEVDMAIAPIDITLEEAVNRTKHIFIDYLIWTASDVDTAQVWNDVGNVGSAGTSVSQSRSPDLRVQGQGFDSG